MNSSESPQSPMSMYALEVSASPTARDATERIGAVKRERPDEFSNFDHHISDFFWKHTQANASYTTSTACSAGGMRHLVYHYILLDDRFATLAVFLGEWAAVEGIRDEQNMSCIALTLMLIHFLQCGVDPPILPNLHVRIPELFASTDPNFGQCEWFRELLRPGRYHSGNDLTVYELLVGFCDYYSSFNYRGAGISVAQGSICERPVGSEVIFFIEDPFDRRRPVLPTIKDEARLSHMIQIFRLHSEVVQSPEMCTQQQIVVNEKTEEAELEESASKAAPQRPEDGQGGAVTKVRRTPKKSSPSAGTQRPSEPARTQRSRRSEAGPRKPPASRRHTTSRWKQLLIFTILIAAAAQFYLFGTISIEFDSFTLPAPSLTPSEPIPESLFGRFVLDRSATDVHLGDGTSEFKGFFPEEVELKRSRSHRDAFDLSRLAPKISDIFTNRMLDQDYITTEDQGMQFKLRYTCKGGIFYEHLAMANSKKAFSVYAYQIKGEHLVIEITIALGNRVQERYYKRI